MNKQIKFSGPLLIIGMPRSGTKLLKSIINQHSEIYLPHVETNFFPYFYHHIHKYNTFRKRKDFSRFYNDFTKTPFFQRFCKGNEALSENVWFSQINNWSYAGVLETFFIYYAKKAGKKMWGDKTPSYLLQIPLLKEIFPAAKFIHIIRDVRDYVLSAQKIWGKNIYRAAQRWKDYITICRNDAQKIAPTDYFEIKYEALIESPEKTIMDICDFLEITFEKNMLNLTKTTENFGDTRNEIGIINTNSGKWKDRLSKDKVEKIEKICGKLLVELGYQASYSGEPQNINKWKLMLYKLFDGFNLIKFHCRKTNFQDGLKNVYKLKKYSAYK